MKVFCAECAAPENAYHQDWCSRAAKRNASRQHLPPADAVNSPDHYRWLPVEVIEITEHFNFRMGNALKYIMRADHKGKPIEDIRKAIWYLNRELESRLADESSV